MSSLLHPAPRPGGGDTNGRTAEAQADAQGPRAPAVARRPDDILAEGVLRVLRDDGTLDPKLDPGISTDEQVALYKAMTRVRILDERLVTLQRQGRIGFHIGALGEEATILGSVFALRERDWVFPCYREFGAALWRGMPLQRYVDNMFGNARDPAKGRQMPDHANYREAHYTSVSSPIGTQLTQAVGFAWAAKMKKDPLVALTYLGEGATSSSEFHNAMNFAGVFKAPVVFVCRNNGWAISVPCERQTASESFAIKAVAYGIPGVRVDGNDIFAVVKATREAVLRAARGEGPTFIEALTYRLSGHSTSDDPKAYRPDQTLEPWRRLDPIPRLRAILEKSVGWSDADQSAFEAGVDAELREAVATAEKTEAPSIDSLFEDVYAEPTWNLVEQREELLRGPRAKGHGGH